MFCCELIGVVRLPAHPDLDVLIPLVLALRAAVDLEDDLVVVDLDFASPVPDHQDAPPVRAACQLPATAVLVDTRRLLLILEWLL